MGGLVRFFTRHGTAANLLLMAILAFGIYAATQIRAQYLPDVVEESVEVVFRWDDAAPEDMDRSIIAVASPAMLEVEGVMALEAVAREGRAQIELEFEPGWDIERALRDVENALPAARNFPDGMETPTVARDVWRDRVLDVVLSGDLDRATMERLGEQLENDLQRAGVTRANLRGLTAPRMAVIADPAALAQYGLTMSALAQAIEAEAEQTASGQIGNGAARLRAGTDRRDALTISAIRIPTDAGPVPLTDLATIEVDAAGSGRAYFLGGRPAVSISVERGADGDALKIARDTRRVVDAFLATAPDTVEADFIRNRAAEIGDRLNILWDNGIFGLLLVAALLYLFLSPSSALWVAAGIPVAISAGIGLMWLTGQSINMISLFALILCLGIIVDDAIVVAEHVEYRHQRGEPRARAAERAARRMLGPVLASTATTVVAFLSLYFITGHFGSFIATIPMVMAAVLLASLAECFLVLPHHMAHGAARLDRGWVGAPARLVTRGFEWMRRRAFIPAMRGVIRLRYAVLLGAVALTCQAVMMLIDRDVAWRFFSPPAQATLSANLAMRDGATREDTMEMIAEVNRASDAVRARFEAEYGRDPITYILSEIGGTAGRGLAVQDDKDEDLLASVSMEMIDSDLRPYEPQEFIQALEAELRRPDTLEIFAFRAGRWGPGGGGMEVVFFAPELETLKAASLSLQEALEAYPEVTGVEDNLTFSGLDHELTVTGYGRALGFQSSDLAAELNARLGGVEAHTYLVGAREATIEVELPEDSITEGYLDEIRLQSPVTGEWARLGEIVEVSGSPAMRVLRREAGLSMLTVSGEIDDSDANRAEQVQAEIETEILPRIASGHGVTYRIEGMAAQEETFLSDAMKGYAVCLLGIYMVLALVLGNWSQPLTIMAVVPFGITGVIWGHWAWDMPMSIFSVVGCIGMSGIIVNDSIVLVSAISEKLPRRATIPAVVEAASERLRPVLLTTLTTVLGLAPLLFESSRQAEFLKPMVVTLVYGLGLGFFIVLLVVPSLYVIRHDVDRAFRSARRYARHRLSGRRRRGLGQPG